MVNISDFPIPVQLALKASEEVRNLESELELVIKNQVIAARQAGRRETAKKAAAAEAALPPLRRIAHRLSRAILQVFGPDPEPEKKRQDQVAAQNAWMTCDSTLGDIKQLYGVHKLVDDLRTKLAESFMAFDAAYPPSSGNRDVTDQRLLPARFRAGLNDKARQAIFLTGSEYQHLEPAKYFQRAVAALKEADDSMTLDRFKGLLTWESSLLTFERITDIETIRKWNADAGVGADAGDLPPQYRCFLGQSGAAFHELAPDLKFDDQAHGL
ncbi:MAG: hypothetical protein ACREN8_12360 [Candidatus Dormibacteraceae bacterium]